jgi:hypothetical protein
MRFRTRVTVGLLAAVLTCGAVVVSGQAGSTAVNPGTYTPPRTAWGDPDLQGTWPSTHMVGVPFERPVQFGTRRWLTDEEFEQRQRQAERQQELDLAEVDVENPSKEILAMGDVGGPHRRRPTGSSAASRRASRRSSSIRRTAGCRP